MTAIFGAVSLLVGASAVAQECPREGASGYCCRLADPLDGKSVAEGGYGWYPSSGKGAGLCQGLASLNVSQAVLSVHDLREAVSFGRLPEFVEISLRPLPIAGPSEVGFVGRPRVLGNTFRVAGAFDEAGSITWNTKPFYNTLQDLESFGFAARLMIGGVVFYTPLVLTKTGESQGQRAAARLALRSSRSINDARITMTPLDADSLLATGAGVRELSFTQPQSRLLSIKLAKDLPEFFRIGVAYCTLGMQDCDLDAPVQHFRIVWPAQ